LINHILAKGFELLDSPGIIPLPKKMDQSDALLIVACNSIVSAAYDNQGVASHLMQWIQALHLMGQGDVVAPEWRNKCLQRYGFDPCVP
jgi:ribosome biogenesis GTPase A